MPGSLEFRQVTEGTGWRLTKMWITDPDGTRIVLVQVPEDHPIRRDQRGL